MPATSSVRRSSGGGGSRGSAARKSVNKSATSSSTTTSSSINNNNNNKQAGLRELAQKRILTDVFENCKNAYSGWTILVVDQEATRVLSNAVGMYDIMEQHVMLVEDLSKARAPFHDKAVIYLLAPREESVNKMCLDYTSRDDGRPLYGQSAFVFFLGRLPDRLVEKVKECKPLLKKLKKFAELNVDFLAKEERAFHLDMRSSFRSVFGTSTKRGKVEYVMADKLVTVCATLNEYPHVRFPQSSKFCQSLAKQFQSRMDQLLRTNSEFWYHGDGQHTDRDRGVLLLMDRREDCLSPLMHEFTYQALVNDVLPISDDMITLQVEASAKDDTGKAVKQDVLLNEKDALWVELRSKHIADVGQILSHRIREMINSDTSKVTSRGSEEVMSVEQMSKALRALPEYREVMSKLSQHLRLSQLCWDKLKELKLVELSQVEQTLATGQDEDGRTPKMSEMIESVEEELRTLTDNVLKIRLVMILMISQGGIKEQYKERVYRAANLKGSAERLIRKLEILGIPTVNSNESTRVLKFFGGSKIKASGLIDEETEYNTRYVPPLQQILEELNNNSLSFDDYPSLLPMPEAMGMVASSGSAHSARKRDAGSARKGGTTSRWQKSAPKETKKPGLFSGGRVIVFTVGGMSYSELRVARTVMEKDHKEIIAGSTHFIKPKDFLKDIDKLSSSS